MNIVRIFFSFMLVFFLTNVHAGVANQYWDDPLQYNSNDVHISKSVSVVAPLVRVVQILPKNATEVIVVTSDGKQQIVKVGTNTIIGGLNIDNVLFGSDIHNSGAITGDGACIVRIGGICRRWV